MKAYHVDVSLKDAGKTLAGIKLISACFIFPLISTGVYGFPKDKALQIAVTVFSQFLLENEMEIILVVFDKRSFQLSGQIVGDIDSYIDTNYVRESHRKEYPIRNRRSTYIKELAEEDFNEEMLQSEETNNYPIEKVANMKLTELCMPLENISLEDQLANIEASFHDKLFELIDKAHLDNKDVWKRANLDREHFSKIQCDHNYHPKKKTVMALCIALQLNLEQSRDLLARADWAFSPSSNVDLIVQKAIIDKQYDIMQLNVTLFSEIKDVVDCIADKTLAELEKEGVFVFPSSVRESEDLTNDQMILQSYNDMYVSGNIMGFLGVENQRLVIESRFSRGERDYFFQYLLEKILEFPNFINLEASANQDERLFSLLLFLFPRYLRDAMRKGLFKTYICKKYNDGNVRGSIDVARHIKNTE